MREEKNAAAVLGLLDDEYARSILTETSVEPMSATELADVCDASLSTVYRRVDELEDRGLLRTDTAYDPDGDHYQVYESAVDHVDVDIDDGDLTVAVSRDEDRVDRFARAWDGIRGDGE